jgi:chromate transporter
MLIKLFLSMLKVGLFTFGGGYAMISLLENEFVMRRFWITSDEFIDLVAIAESTPGPIAINCATYIGYRHGGFFGALLATLGMCIPSFTIICLISLVFDRFLEILWVAAAFRGIQVCVVYLILSAGIKIFKKIKKTAFNLAVSIITLAAILTFSFLKIGFSSIFYILIFGFLGLFLFLISYIRENRKGGARNDLS